MNEDQIRKIIEKVAAEVNQEATRFEKSFGVSDLTSHFKGLSKAGLDNAWTITYTTSDAAIKPNNELINPRFDSAWSISYSTSDASILAKNKNTK